jgi:phage gp37-like protein
MLRVDEIEDAILAKLQGNSALASYVRTFTVIPSLDEESLTALIKKFPAIGVISQRGTYDYALSSVEQETGMFAVLCFNRNLRSAVAAVRGSGSEKGVWEVIEDCRRTLLGGLDVDVIDCLPVRRVLLWAGEKWAAASLEVQVTWRNL